MDKGKLCTGSRFLLVTDTVYGIDGASPQTRTALTKAWSVSVSDSDADKIACVTASGEKKKVGVVLRKYDVRVK
jgi:hypothetical protein